MTIEMMNRLKRLEERVEAQEREIAELKAQLEPKKPGRPKKEVANG